jgi:stage II sporulation protein D
VTATPTARRAAGAVLAAAALTLACASGPSSSLTVAPPRPLPESAAVQSPPPDEPTPEQVAADPLPGIDGVRIRITDAGGTRIVTLPLDEYVLGCVRAEIMPGALKDDSSLRFLQVQAIVSRSYALTHIGRHAKEGFDLCDGTHCQLYRPGKAGEHASDVASRAVLTTQGQVLTYQNRVVQALFHSGCGGHTAAAEDVWGGDSVPYLRPVPDWFCSRTHSGDWTFEASDTDLRRALNADPVTSIGDRLDRIDVTERDPAGRAVLVTVAGTRTPMVRAEEFRTVMRRAFGPRSIKSTWFTVTRQGNRFVFSGAGYGHGVGLCQAGAAERAKAGQPAAEILAHYFPGTRIKPLSVLAGAGGVPVLASRIP